MRISKALILGGLALSFFASHISLAADPAVGLPGCFFNSSRSDTEQQICDLKVSLMESAQAVEYAKSIQAVDPSQLKKISDAKYSEVKTSCPGGIAKGSIFSALAILNVVAWIGPDLLTGLYEDMYSPGSAGSSQHYGDDWSSKEKVILEILKGSQGNGKCRQTAIEYLTVNRAITAHLGGSPFCVDPRQCLAASADQQMRAEEAAREAEIQNENETSTDPDGEPHHTRQHAGHMQQAKPSSVDY